MIKKRVVATVMASLMLVSTIMTGCAPKATEGTATEVEPKAVEQVVNASVLADPMSFDSSKINEAAANTVVLESQEGLVRLGEGMKIMPAGATKWESSADGLEWTFHLRDYKWSDGSSVVAQDFVYAIKRMFDPATACPNAPIFYCIKGGEAFNTGKGTADGVGAVAVDDKTLKVILEKPVPYFIQLTNFISLFPLKQSVVEKAGETYGTDPKAMVFSGPFVVEQWVKGSKIVLKKNPSYWDAANVKLDTVNIHIVPEQATREQLFDSKGLDMLSDVKGEYVAKLSDAVKKGDVTELKGFYPACSYVAFNNSDPKKIFTNAKVRLAFSLAIDREAYTKNVVKKDIPAYGFVPNALNNGTKLYRDSVPEPLKTVLDKDPKTLYQEGLKELGLDPNSVQTVTFLQKNASSDFRVIGEFYQDQWQKKLGVQVKIDVASDAATFNKMVDKGEYQVAQVGWGADYDDPMTFMEMFLTKVGSGSSNNSVFFSNPEYDKLVKAAGVESDMAKRLEMFKKAEQILVVDQAGLAPVSFQLKVNFVQPKLNGVLFQAGGPQFELKNAYIK